ncbi:MAG TPA: nitroreductase/quinone reductase family protein, partial [Acidimicrobiia bacterium]|nr:nitroreductase/quinone reductase family protein [Acidimicrobiia bacterium]
ASVQIGSRTEKVRARTATAGEKAYWWPKMAGRYKGYDSYQRRTDREIPVVILEKVELAGGLA